MSNVIGKSPNFVNNGIKFLLFIFSLLLILIFVSELNSRETLEEEILKLERRLEGELLENLLLMQASDEGEESEYSSLTNATSSVVGDLIRNESPYQESRLIRNKQEIIEQLKLHVALLSAHGEIKGVLSRERVTFFIAELAQVNDRREIGSLTSLLKKEESKVKAEIFDKEDFLSGRLELANQNLKRVNFLVAESSTKENISMRNEVIQDLERFINGNPDEDGEIPLPLEAKLKRFMLLHSGEYESDEISLLEVEELRDIYAILVNFDVYMQKMRLSAERELAGIKVNLANVSSDKLKKSQGNISNDKNASSEERNMKIWLHLSSSILLGWVMCLSSLVGILIILAREKDVLSLRHVTIGLSTGVVVFLSTKSAPELLLNFSNNKVTLNPYSCAFFALLAGLFSDRVFEVLSKLFRAIEDAVPDSKVNLTRGSSYEAEFSLIEYGSQPIEGESGDESNEKDKDPKNI